MAGYQEFDVSREREQRRIGNVSLIAGAILFWALMVAVAVQDYRRHGGQEWWEPVFWEISSALVGSFIFYLQLPLLLDQNLLQTPRLWFARLLRYLPLVCISFVILTFSLRHAVYAFLGRSYSHDPWLSLFIYESIKLSIFVGLFYVVVFGVQSYLFLLREKARAEKAFQLFQQAQLQNLSQQLQPHFLFNALNTISSLMYSDIKAADTALNRLAQLLRHHLDAGEQSVSTVEQELTYLRAYAELMQLRFVDRVEIKWEIDAATLARPVPSLCLQLLLENTFKHTVEQRSGFCTIHIAAQIREQSLVLAVQDNLGTLSDVAGQAPKPGIGLNNLRQRLALMPGMQTSLQIQNQPQAGVRTEIVISPTVPDHA